MSGSIHKSRKDKMILGVCGGVGEYLGVDSSIVRILWAVASFVYGSGLFLYIIAALILPYDENDSFVKNDEPNPERKQKHNKVIAIILIMSGTFLILRNLSEFFNINTRYLWPILLIVSGLLLIIKGKENNDEK